MIQAIFAPRFTCKYLARSALLNMFNEFVMIVNQKRFVMNKRNADILLAKRLLNPEAVCDYDTEAFCGLLGIQ